MPLSQLISYVRARLGRSEAGSALVEYVLLLSLIVLVSIAAVQLLGGGLDDRFSSVADSVECVPQPNC